MSDQSGKRKPARPGRRKKQTPDNETKFGIHNVPKDIVDIERNIVENWLLSLKHWAKVNQNIARYIIIGLAVVFVLTLSVIFVVTQSYDSHNERFYAILQEYEKSVEMKKTAPEDLKPMIEKSDKLCNLFFSTKYSNNGCLLSAIMHLQANEPDQAAKALERYSKGVPNNGASAFALFFAAYHNESGDISASIENYETLKNRLKPFEKEDIGLFHLARMYYYKNDFDRAEQMMNHLLDTYKSSAYAGAAKKYLMLIALKKSVKAQGTAKAP